MLNLAGRRPVMLSFDRAGHGIEDMDDIDKAYSGIAGFLRQHLGAAGSAAAAVAASDAPAVPATAPATH
jgi:hypothetical protein